MGKAAGAFGKILPAPPKNREDANKILERLKQLSGEELKQMEDSITRFATGGNTKEFLDEIMEKFEIATSSEMLDLFINIKDLIVDKKILQEFNKLYNLERKRAEDLEAILDEISQKFENNLRDLEKKILTLDEGFKIITPIYFYSHKSEGINYWKEGWKPRLIDAHANLDYKRNAHEASPHA